MCDGYMWGIYNILASLEAVINTKRCGPNNNMRNLKETSTVGVDLQACRSIVWNPPAPKAKSRLWDRPHPNASLGWKEAPSSRLRFFFFFPPIFSISLLWLRSLKWRQRGDKDRKRENVYDSSQLNHTSLIKPLEHLHRAWIKYQALPKTWFSLQKTNYGDLLTL